MTGEPDTTAPDEVIKETTLQISEAAQREVLRLRQEEDEPATRGLRISIDSPPGQPFRYDLVFVKLSTVALSDIVEHHGALRVVIPGADVTALRGATLDHSPAAGLTIRNPNRPGPVSVEGFTLEGERAQDVMNVLIRVVNPQLAIHGGEVQLVGVRGGEVALCFAGGCQGCALSRNTMSDGIETTLRAELSWFESVLDVTDHAAGKNPYLR